MSTRELLGGPDEHIDPVLAVVREPIRRVAGIIVERFYNIVAYNAPTSIILDHLSKEEFSRLKRNQAQYLTTLLAPELTEEAHLAAGERVGRIHALVGVDLLSLIEAFTVYQQEIYRLLFPLIPQAAGRESLMRIISERILFDLKVQASVFRRIDAEAAEAHGQIDQHLVTASNLRDIVRGIMAIFGQLEGDVSAFFGRADAQGHLQIEATFGQAAEAYHQAMEDGRAPKVSTDADQIAGQGPGGRAWRSGEIVVTDAWGLHPDHAPWRAASAELGLRSSASVPIVDSMGHSLALLALYSRWPGYFSTPRVSALLNHTQEALSGAVQQRAHVPVVPFREQKFYRNLLEERRVTMLYQPIIDLRNGRLAKVEALARLQTADNELIAPNRFLPSLGEYELLQLFEIGLRQACADFPMFDALGLETLVAINFPAEGFGDARYEEVLFTTLSAGGLPPQRLQLEMLETQDKYLPNRQRFYRKLQDAGIHIAQDDLGSGHSSLLRLNQYTFDEVKIDQGLVRNALSKPQRALEFILHISRLAHAFKTPVTVEGLETAGMIEAAAILGADHGQGYGLSRPISATQVVDWYGNFTYSPDVQNPHTALGAMAGYLLWDLQLAAICHRPQLVEEFAGTTHFLDRFIQARNLADSPLDQILRQNHVSARHEPQGATYQKSRTQVIEILEDYCLLEVQRP